MEPDYTAAETAAMITQYQNTNAAQFADEKINLLNIGDPQYESYYRNNAALDTSFGSMMGGTFAGIGQGTANAAEKTVDYQVSLTLAWTRDKTPEEHLYNGIKGTLGIGQEQEGLFNIGTPALYALSGPVGSGIRAMAATNGALQFGEGAKQAVEGDSWKAAGNMVFGALGMASLGVPRVTAGGANSAVRPATVASDEVVLAPYQPTGRTWQTMYARLHRRQRSSHAEKTDSISAARKNFKCTITFI